MADERFWGRAERASRTLSLLLLLSACSASDAREEIALAKSSASTDVTIASVVVVPASASAAVSASSAPSAEALAADEPEQASPPVPGDCNLPATRPASFGVKQLQHILPHGRPDSWAGGELSTKSNVCPRNPRAHVVAACTTVSDAQMDAVYKALVGGRFCSLRHHSPPRRSSPHYGSRSITVYIGERSFEMGDSSGELLDEPSNKRFYTMTDAITSAGLAASPPP